MAQERTAPPRTARSRPLVRGAALAFGALILALPARALAAPGSETSVTVTNNPLVVYGVVALLVGAVVLALFAARPSRAGLGKKPLSPRSHGSAEGLPWMPGGDIFGGPAETEQAPTPSSPRQAPPPSPTGPASQSPNPWSTGAPGAPPRWG